MNPDETICMVPRLNGIGGPASFQHKFALGLRARGIQVVYDLDDRPYRTVLVVGGTRRLAGLLRAKRRGAQIIQRLDGMNWMHRRRRTGLRHYLRAEYGNLILGFIRTRLADRVVYQSLFARQWWEEISGALQVPADVIYNGVDLDSYAPQGSEVPPKDRWRLLLVEGSLAGGYELGLEHAIRLAAEVRLGTTSPVELVVAGRVSTEVQARASREADFSIVWAGHVSREQIPSLDRSAHLLFSADLNAACPNAVIEALSCGLPVLSFESGALPELLGEDSGVIVPYGGDPWRLDPPDFTALGRGALEILSNQERYRAGARVRAEERFGLEPMLDAYLKVIV